MLRSSWLSMVRYVIVDVLDGNRVECVLPVGASKADALAELYRWRDPMDLWLFGGYKHWLFTICI